MLTPTSNANPPQAGPASEPNLGNVVSASASAAPIIGPQSPTEVRNEVRLALVMYGGVSLAIYMNGITRELLNLVRATSLVPGAGQTSTERVYRKLAQILSKEDDDPSELSRSDPVRTRFVIDVISGTSAGGINGIFLAKALANDQPFDKLHDLWIKEGDFAKLINDKDSCNEGVGALQPQRPPVSLLNSERMYIKLYQALLQMDEAPTSSQPFPYTDVLDLFVTTTDIRGQVLPIRLYDKLVEERRYKFDFHFKYAGPTPGQKEQNDFRAGNTPFIAFAARCTSSFPFAFEPMRYGDIDRLVNCVDPKFDKTQEQAADWDAFFTNDLPMGDRPQPPEERSFGDGGYLNNKPFSYVTDTLRTRSSAASVNRILFYIEPSPDDPRDTPSKEDRPNAIENTYQALVALPLDQTIREDLQRILERNREINRLRRIIHALEADSPPDDEALRESSDLWRSIPKQPEIYKNVAVMLNADYWAQGALRQSLRGGNFAYSGYEHLKVAATTDDLALLISCAAGFDENSDEFYAIRCLARAWRERAFDETESSRTLRRFLLNFDIGYRLRRLRFLLRRASELSALDKASCKMLKSIAKVDASVWDKKAKSEFRDQIFTIKGQIHQIFQRMQADIEKLKVRPHQYESGKPTASNNDLFKLIAQLGIDRTGLYKILGASQGPEGKADFAFDEERAVQRAATLLDDPQVRTGLDNLRATLSDKLADIWKNGSDAIIFALGSDITGLSPVQAAAYQALRHYFDRFEDFDAVVFPITYGTDFGEPIPVSVVRISPEDATAIINERATGTKKLAGAKLFHFGAFLEESWRRNDILWGRLDGAERIIEALLPEGHPRRNEADKLIQEAQHEIIEEELVRQSRLDVGAILAKALLKAGKESNSALLECVQKQPGANVNQNVTNVLRATMNPQQLREALPQCPVDPEPNRAETLRSLARSARVVGQILEKISGEQKLAASWTRWVARFGTVFWGLVEVAIPRSFGEAFTRYWLGIVFVLEGLLFAGGLLLGHSSVEHFGLELFGITLGLWVAVKVLNDYFTFRGARTLTEVGILAILFLVLLSFLEWGHLPADIKDMWRKVLDLVRGT